MSEKKKNQRSAIGKIIKKAREKKKITFDVLANDTGLAIDHLKKIESGKATPPVGILLQISKALKIDSSSLLKGEEENMENRIKEYTKRTKNYAYETLTPGAENKHLKAFRVSIDPKKEHEGVGYFHEGEEFVYVIEGAVEVTVGDHVNRLKASESLHFNSGIRHQLKNVSDKQAELLVVIYSP